MRHLKRLDREARERVLKAVEEIAERPRLGSTLLFDERRLYKFRVGDYRIVYEVDEEKKTVLFHDQP